MEQEVAQRDASLPSLAVRKLTPAGEATRAVLNSDDQTIAVCVVRGDTDGDGGSGDTSGDAATPQTQQGRFSQRKGQCDLWEFVWGSTFVAAELAAAVGVHRRAEGGSERRRRCLELGCGSGVSSVVGALAGLDFCATDAVCDALRVSARTALLNGVGVDVSGGDSPFDAALIAPADPSVTHAISAEHPSSAPAGSVRYRVLDWHRDPNELRLPDLSALEPGGVAGGDDQAEAREDCTDSRFDLILGADVLFFGRAARPVARCCGALIARGTAQEAQEAAPQGGGLVVVVDPARGHAETFASYLEDEGLDAVSVTRRENIAPVLGGNLAMRACELVIGYRHGDTIAAAVADAVLQAFDSLPQVSSDQGGDIEGGRTVAREGNEFAYVLKA